MRAALLALAGTVVAATAHAHPLGNFTINRYAALRAAPGAVTVHYVDHQHDHHHDHGGVGWRNLVALGVSGGLLPCPSALVVMLGAIALGRIAFGLLLIVAFSAGLAAVLTGVGLMLVYARRQFERLPLDGRLARLAPVASALVISAAGLAIVAEALVRIGVWL